MIIALPALLGLLGSSALAHDRDACPPINLMQGAARRGGLNEAMRECLRRETDDEHLRGAAVWALWRDRQAREGSTAEVVAEAESVLDITTHPDLALETAELLADDSPEAARRALDVAFELGGWWRMTSVRVDRAHRAGQVLAKLDERGAVRWAQGLAELGVTGERLTQARAACAPIAGAEACAQPVAMGIAPRRAATADDLIPCTNVGHLFTRAWWGPVYTTERDCVAAAASRLPEGAARDSAARLATLLAVTHEDRDVAAVVVRIAYDASPQDAIAATAWRLHDEGGDAPGAKWWVARHATEP